MAKKASKTSRSTKSKSDNSLMLLAAAAALIVGFFAVVTYKSKSVIALPTPAPVVINLDSQNKSYESGTATLQEVDGKVVVTLALTGGAAAVAQPAHIHVGSCPNVGAVKYPLTSVVDGKSVTTIDTTLAQLKSMEPLAINVHKSASQINSYVSCGDLKL